MRLDIFDINKFIEVNSNCVKEVSNPIYFERGMNPTPKGLFSYELFGRTSTDRKEIWGYIDLKDKYLHPFVYKVLKRLEPKLIDGIINGLLMVSINDEGRLEDDPNGWTGIDNLYKNFTKIKFERDSKSTARERRMDVIKNLSIDEIFVDKWLVCPPFYRDKKSEVGGVAAVDLVNEHYSNIMKRVNFVQNEKKSGFSFSIDRTKFSIQNILLEIYNYFTKEPNLSKKRGLLRKSLMGKNVDNGARLVITAPRYNLNYFDEDAEVTFDRAGVPLATICAIFYPYIFRYVRDFLDKELLADKRYPIMRDGKLKYIELDDPESLFTNDYIEKMIENFVKSPLYRYETIELPNKEGIRLYMYLSGRYSESGRPEDVSNILSRKMTITDLLYMAAMDVTHDKHVLITRYPLTNYTGVFPCKIHVLSTINTMPAYISDRVYSHFPVMDNELSDISKSVSFINTLQMSNLYLEAIGGDYDGDQVSVRSVMSQDANAECHEYIYSKRNLLSVSGAGIRSTSRETTQTLYNLTKGVDDL